MPAYYAKIVERFLTDPDSTVLAELTSGYALDRYAELKTLQIEAWRKQISTLRTALEFLARQLQQARSWGLLLEYPIPRRMGRIDCIILIANKIVVLEFKGDTVDNSAVLQVEDYALDLSYFHRPSHDRELFPIVVGGLRPEGVIGTARKHRVKAVQIVKSETLATALGSIAESKAEQVQLSVESWDKGEYYPVPTVIEAAVGMFQDMKVDDIARADADPKNLGKTIDELRQSILHAKANE